MFQFEQQQQKSARESCKFHLQHAQHAAKRQKNATAEKCNKTNSVRQKRHIPQFCSARNQSTDSIRLRPVAYPQLRGHTMPSGDQVAGF